MNLEKLHNYLQLILEREEKMKKLAYFFYSTIFACGIIDAVTYLLFWMGYGFGYGEVPRWAFATFMLLWGVLGLIFTKEGQNKKEW